MIDLKQYGYTETGIALPDGTLPARVTAVHKERFELIASPGTMHGRLKTGSYYGTGAETFPTVGDFVHIRPTDGGDAQIVKTLPRKSVFIRRDPNPNAGEQAVAANMDYVFIMSSLNQDFNLNRIERYLVLGRKSGATPVVVLTKADLSSDADMQVAAVQAIAGSADVHAISVRSGIGMDAINSYLVPGKTVVFLGMSGVGKSSLLNALMGTDVMDVSDIREDDSRGRHTTTRRQLIMLPSGAMVIDTPGMRTLGMWDASDGLSETFSDIEELLRSCRFSDCRHDTEPGCAIREAIDNGTLTAKRWENYKSLKREALYADDKAAAMRDKWERNKHIARWSRNMKKSGKIRY